MIDNIKTNFLTKYILSLKERTRIEKNVKKFGLDWVIFNLSIQKNLFPVRLPFHRAADAKDFKSKTEAEFGIDLSFIDKTNGELKIFVLKDERLKNNTWITNNFEADLRNASSPDLSGIEVNSVKIILAYNKDDDSSGVKLYDNLVSNMPTKIKDTIKINYERWNIDKIVEEIETYMLTPELLPQHLTGMLSYICAQIGDFDYLSEQWSNQLVINWKGFLKILFSDVVDERRIMLVPVTLIILRNYMKSTPDAKLGLLDLTEWGMLHLWSLYRNLENEDLKKLIWQIWYEFYILELDKYIDENEKGLTIEHGIHSNKNLVGNLSTLNDTVLVYDLIGKMGIVHSELNNLLKVSPENKEIENRMYKYSEYIISCLKNNPATLRPLIDIHHIQLFFIWVILYQSQNKNELINFFNELESNLMIRRIGNSQIPFIEGRNNLELVAEYVATKDKPYEFVDDSSYLLTMLLELTFTFDIDERKTIHNRLFKRVVLGIGDDNKFILKDKAEIDLQSWEPPDDWDTKIFLGQVAEGVAVTTANFEVSNENLDKLDENIKSFIKNTIKKFPPKIHFDISESAYYLACLKHASPLPPLFWRGTLFTDYYKES